ncbi:MAG TPA: S8 family serine peptidase [Candidatus Eisenbacteria bacterium]|nr:S8 family serine peptidase [Candidatus Eisenbacteria bacterium]
MIERRFGTIGVAAVLLAAASVGCGDKVDRRPANTIVVAPVAGPGGARFYPRDPHRHHSGPGPSPAPGPAVVADSIAPELRARIGSHVRDTVVVSLIDTVTVRRFPAPATGKAFTNSGTAILDLKNRREVLYSAFTDSLDSLPVNAHARDRFWICQAEVVEMPLDSIPLLFRLPWVTYVEPLHPHVPPPGDCQPQSMNQARAVAVGRNVIGSDSWRAKNLPAHRMGLLDTGVNPGHVLFSDPSPLGLVQTCIGSDPDVDHCQGEEAGDTDVSTPHGHGTESAAILVGNDAWSDVAHGITQSTLDVFRVYTPCQKAKGCAAPECTPDPDLRGAICGLQDAIAAGDAVIVAELQETGNVVSALCRSADHAYDAGRLVVAAAGNHGPDGPIGGPARARKAIAAGARDVTTGCTSLDQSRGQTSDGRYKPDLQGPTGTQTAGSCCAQDVSAMGHTSGATPYVAGAASLLWDWLQAKAGENPVAPGQVCAALIACGGEPGLDESERSVLRGAGLVHLPQDGVIAFDYEVLGDNDGKDVPVPLDDPDIRDVSVGLWWPENQELGPHNKFVDTHSTILLHVLDPTGREVGKSVRPAGVFQHVRVPVAGTATGTWTLRIDSPSVLRPPQTVYWCVVARHGPPVDPTDGTPCPE